MFFGEGGGGVWDGGELNVPVHVRVRGRGEGENTICTPVKVSNWLSTESLQSFQNIWPKSVLIRVE